MDNSRIFLISDLHIGHRNILKYCQRPFSSVEEMNNALINNWNSIITNNDRVFMLGDFCLTGKDKIIEVGRALNGRKTLIMGNHESGSKNTYYQAGFEYISKYPILYNNQILFSHEPIPNTKYFNIHGHIHNKDITEIDYITGNYHLYFNVSAEKINYTPINLKDIPIFNNNNNIIGE